MVTIDIVNIIILDTTTNRHQWIVSTPLATALTATATAVVTAAIVQAKTRAIVTIHR